MNIIGSAGKIQERRYLPTATTTGAGSKTDDALSNGDVGTIPCRALSCPRAFPVLILPPPHPQSERPSGPCIPLQPQPQSSLLSWQS